MVIQTLTVLESVLIQTLTVLESVVIQSDDVWSAYHLVEPGNLYVGKHFVTWSWNHHNSMLRKKIMQQSQLLRIEKD